MIRWALHAPWRGIDGACRARRGKCGRQQHMVDAKAHAAAKRPHAIVPPAEGPFGLLKKPKRVDESQLEKAPKRGALRLAEQHVAFPGLWIVNIAILGRDIKVA